MKNMMFGRLIEKATVESAKRNASTVLFAQRISRNW